MSLVSLPVPALIALAVGLMAALLAVVLRPRGRWPTLLVASLAIGILLCSATPIPRVLWDVAYYLDAPPRRVLVEVDFRLSVLQRERIVALATSDRLGSPNERGGLEMPEADRGLSLDGDVTVWEDGCGTSVFFMTIVGFSPDPYAGFEYSAGGCPPAPDPLGSGHGEATHLGGGWYWIEAR